MDSGIIWLAADTEGELHYRYRYETQADLRPRWQALWLLHQGYTRKAVVQALGINPRTLRAWLAWYQTGGCAEVARHRLGGGQGHSCLLTIDQQAELAAWAEVGTFYTIDEVRRWVAATWQIAYTYDGMRSLLDRLGIHARMPRPLAAQADVDAQSAWKKGG